MAQGELIISDEETHTRMAGDVSPALPRLNRRERAWAWLGIWWQANRLALMEAAVVFFAMRIILSIVSVLASAMLPEQAGLHSTYHLSTNIWLDVWARWDSEYYLDIAQYGYETRPELLVFSPLYPLLLRILAPLLGQDFVLSGVVVSSVATFLALFYMFKLAALELGEGAARRALLYLAIYPVSFFLLAVYTESTFLAITLASFYYARQGAWAKGAVGAFLAGLARPTGLILALPFAYEVMRQSDWRLRNLSVAKVVAVFAGPLGWVLWAIYLGTISNDPLAVLHSRSQPPFRRTTSLPWDTVGAAFERLGSVGLSPLERAVNSMDLVATLIIIEVAILAWFALPRAYALYSGLSAWLLLSLTVGDWPLQSMGRYSLAVFPLFLLMAKLGENPRWHLAIVIGSATLLGLLTALFATWYWIF